ncbi:Glucose-responsive transcription factor [Claviceps purpurea]|nr:Glucose-responsive transcription factor [Claviceps purpurea]KAG6157379.1 Glucose-responsive transcription factor [Claviceps purpurea]KAG6189694.1 Glucose-responsive transcription factor [Claviceps purpurea]KAG6189776.1 Glucose-responsive transcription factor [Claviceps purpurea]KAG6216748.1 Glucose-responsive transcription factor [Claviceps purpurea]
MANSKFEYVRNFEQTDSLLPNTWIVVRIDGRAFTKMCAKYGFEKPNDRRALDLMNAAAKAVVTDLPESVIAYGVSDEYSFVFHKSCNLFERRASKLVSTIVSTFTANYVYSWGTYFPDTPLSFPLPTFDGRAVCYPSVQNLRDYLSWRQVDCHINNLYNTTFWLLIQLGGLDNKEAERTLAGTLAADKNEILFSRFNINYNNEPEIFKKGSVIFRDYELVDAERHAVALEMDDLAEPVQQSKSQAERDRKKRAKARIVVEHTDIIKDEFWNRRPWILSNKPGQAPKIS